MHEITRDIVHVIIVFIGNVNPVGVRSFPANAAGCQAEFSSFLVCFRASRIVQNFPEVSPRTNTECSGAKATTCRATLWGRTPECERLRREWLTLRCSRIEQGRPLRLLKAPVSGVECLGGAVDSSYKLSHASLAAPGTRRPFFG